MLQIYGDGTENVFCVKGKLELARLSLINIHV